MPDSGLEGSKVELGSTDVDLGSRQLAVTDSLSLDRVARTRFAALVLEHSIPHTARLRWPTEAGSIDELLPFALMTARTHRIQSALIDLRPVLGEPCFAHVSLEHGMVYLDLAAPEHRVLDDAEAWLREIVPPVEPSTEQILPISFWSLGGGPIVRRIAVPSWSEIRGNYPAAVSNRLATLMSESADLSERGRLLLWHGDPGTGKTYALRALGWEWREWCRLHYVTDPESFFAERADYMLDVLVGEEDEDDEGSRWRLVILEDTGELLAADAKERTGQGLSRLLNVVDGILGQGLRVLVLMTTNEPLGRLHEAVVRPGRCASKIHFRAFTPQEAAEWLAVRGEGESLRGSTTLAGLYAGPRHEEEVASTPFGFSR
jgi:ATPase family associated with various cellular activities (AAA)